MLAPASDMFYRSQQASVYYYINTVPVWKSIQKSNWKLVEDIARKLAGQQCANLDVWTGGIDVMTLKNDQGKDRTLISSFLTKLLKMRTWPIGADTQVTLTKSDNMMTDVIPVPKFLFKYVVDPVRNRGIVFVTLNNPKVNAITPEDQLCEARIACSTLYPQFNLVGSGYTYCCSIDSTSKFAAIATKLGLPSFPNALPLV